MVTKALIPCLAGVIWLAFANVTPAKGVTYADAAEHYSLQLPDGWKEIPQARVKQTNQFAGQINKQIVYAAAFQRQDRPDFAYPYVLVQRLSNKGRPLSLEDIFQQVAGQDASREIARTTEKMPGLVSQAVVDKPSLDRERRRIYLPLAMNVAGVGKVKGLSVMCFGKQVAVQLHGYAREAEWPAFAPVFDALVDSLQFDPGYEYDERLARQESGWHID